MLAEWFKSSRDRQGPVVTLKLDAPSRGASRIERLKGCVEIAPVDRETVIVKVLASWIDKPLEHPSLKEIKIIPRLKADDDVTEVILETTGNSDRLKDWAIAKGGKPLNGMMLSKSAMGDPVPPNGLGYRRLKVDEDTELRMVIASAREKQSIEFEFVDVELP